MLIRESPPRHVASALGGIAALFLLLAACRSEPPPAPAETSRTPPSPVRNRIERRLAPEDFSMPRTGARAAVVEIEGEAREVVVGPRWVEIAQPGGVRLVEGRATVPVTLPEDVRALSDDAFALSVQEVPAELRGVDQAALGDFARNGLFQKEVSRGWQLRREPGAATALLELDVALADGAKSETPATGETLGFNFRLTAQRPTPVRLQSRRFPVAAGGAVELGFGRKSRPAASGERAPLAYSARLSCDGEVPAVGAEGVLDAPGWRDARLAVPPGSTSCELSLAVDGASAHPTGVYFALPRVIFPVADGDAERGGTPSVVLISLDTLGAAHLSGYGYERETSPLIDTRLIGGGTAFMDVSTTFPRTDVAHLSLFTSLYPNAQPTAGRLTPAQNVRMLAEALRDAALDTAAFTEDGFLAGAFGFWSGFDQFREYSFDSAERGRRVFADAARFLTEKRDRPFFLLVHTYRVHAPYEPSQPYRDLFGGFWSSEPDPAVPSAHRSERDAYDASVREADTLVGGLLERLDQLGLTDRTIVVLLSDHGEAFGEHGVLRHGIGFHQEQLHVPLIFRGPGIPAGKRVTAPASLVDVAPTLLDLLALPPLPDAQGTSLAGAFRGEAPPPDRPLYFSWMRKDAAHGLRQGNWKFIHAGDKTELFDLGGDPGERRPERRSDAIGPEHADELGRIVADGEERRARLAAPEGRGEGAAGVSEETERSLRALGYLD
jgi:arylsulfatase A-like enzyme